jgi:hypothetical protein
MMHAHKTRAKVTKAHQVIVHLPSDFPEGEADVIVIAAEPSKSARVGPEAAEEFRHWLGDLLTRLPPSPVLPPDASGAERRGAC